MGPTWATRIRLRVILTLCLGVTPTLAAQSLSPELLAKVLHGAASIEPAAARTSVPLLGKPTVPLVEVTINGHGPFRLLLDLGSNVFLLRRDVAVAVGARVLIHHAQKDRDIIECDSMRLGGVLFRGVVGGMYEQLDVDGVISYAMLSGLLVVMDFPGRRLSLSRDSLPPVSSGETNVPYDDRSGSPVVPLRMGGTTWSALLDTGATDSLDVPADSLRSLDLESAPVAGQRAWNNQTGTTSTLVGQLRTSASLGPIEMLHPRVVLDNSLRRPQIGMGVLKEWRISLDTQRHVLRFAKSAPQ